MRVRFAPRARKDLEEIFAYIANENPNAASRVRQAIFNTTKLISERPYIGIRNARSQDLRSRLVLPYPYRVHYLLRQGEVLIIHVRNTARRPLKE